MSLRTRRRIGALGSAASIMPMRPPMEVPSQSISIVPMRAMSAAMSAAFQELSAAGVTSMVYFPFGEGGTPNSPLATAQRIGWSPEWVVVGWQNYNAAFLLKDPPTQTAAAFGVGVWNKQPALSFEPFHQAFVEAGGDPATTNLQSARGFYQELLLLASGIQLAGPQLTPETFAAGLRSPMKPTATPAGDKGQSWSSS